MLVLVGLLGGLTAASASASTVSIGFSADPTQDKPITVTVSGTASGARRLHVFVTSGGCSTYLSGQGGTRLSTSAGDAVNGAYTQNYTFTPDSQWAYRVCVFLVNTSGGAIDVATSNVVTPRGGHASASVGFSADPTQDKPITVTVSGSSELPRRLHVFVTSGGCSTYLSGQNGTRLSPSGGAGVDGSFSFSYAFTPDSQWAYRVCVFVERAGGGLDATASGVVTPRGGHASASVGFSADPTQDKPISVNVVGASELPRRVHVFVTSGGCSTYLSGQNGTRLSPSSGEAVNGSFSFDYVFTPDSQWAYRVCVFVERAGGGLDATASGTVTPRGGTATAAVAMERSVVPGQQVPVVVAGTSELPRRLHVFVTSGGCSTYLSGQNGTRLSPNGGVEVHGEYAQSYVFTADRETSYSVCVFVTRGADGGLDATGSASTVARVPGAPESPRPGDRDYSPPGREPVPDVAPPNLLAPATGVSGTLLRPTFSWTSASPARDILVLWYRAEGGFRPYLAVTARGASWVSADDFDDAETLLKALGDPEYRVDGLASLATSGGQATVEFDEDFAPGSYRWTVYTGRDSESGTLVSSEGREFTVHGPALKSLRVKTRARKGSSTTSPGSTELRISTTRYASLRIELRRGGKRSVRNLTAGERTTVTTPVAWSCKKPGGRYRYRVTARDSHGKQRTVSGTFRPVSTARCRSMRKQEQRAKAKRQREVDRRVAERRRAEAAAQRQQTNRFKSNCRKLGGTPRLIGSSDGSYWVCVSPWGGTWNVPM